MSLVPRVSFVSDIVFWIAEVTRYKVNIKNFIEMF